MAATISRPPADVSPPPRRRRSRVGLIVVAAVVAVAAAVAAVAWATGDRPLELGGTVTPIDGPVPLLSQAATVAMGNGTVLIWGGRATTSDSGWVFDPSDRTWEQLPPAPGPSRFSAAAVWTGTEALIWGGSISTPFHLDPGGIAWNPATATWRELPAAPLGLMDARAIAFDTGVLFTGGRDLTGGDRTDLWFDRATETWTPIPTTVEVLNTTWQAGRLVGTGPVPLHAGSQQPATWAVVAFDPVTLTWNHAAPELETMWLALATDPAGQLTAVSSDTEQVRGYALTDGQWVQAAEIRSSAVVTIEPRGYAPVAVWTGDQLVLGAQGGLLGWSPTTRRFASLDDGAVRTFGGTAVWTGEEVVALSSQSSEGWIWSPPPPAAP